MRWQILALLFVTRTAMGFQFQTLGSVGSYLIDDFGLGYTAIGTLIGLFMLPGMFLALPSGWIGRHLSDRVLVTIGLGLLGIGGLIGAGAEGYTALAVARLFCGAGFVLSTIYFTKMTADWFSGRELATALGILVMSWPFGIAIGQLSHEWLAGTQGWQSAFLVASLYCLGGAAAIAALYRTPSTASGGAGAASAGRLTANEVILILIASLSWSLFNAGYVIYLSFAPPVLTGAGFTPLAAAGIVSIGSWTAVLSITGGGIVADRTGKPDLIAYLTLTVAVLSMLAFLWPAWSTLAAFAFGLIGAAPAGIIMALTGAAMRPGNRALGMGVFFTSYFVIIAPAPRIAGWLVDRSGEPYDGMLFGALMFLLALVSYAGFRLAQRLVPLPKEN